MINDLLLLNEQLRFREVQLNDQKKMLAKAQKEFLLALDGFLLYDSSLLDDYDDEHNLFCFDFFKKVGDKLYLGKLHYDDLNLNPEYFIIDKFKGAGIEIAFHEISYEDNNFNNSVGKLFEMYCSEDRNKLQETFLENNVSVTLAA